MKLAAILYRVYQKTSECKFILWCRINTKINKLSLIEQMQWDGVIERKQTYFLEMHQLVGLHNAVAVCGLAC